MDILYIILFWFLITLVMNAYLMTLPRLTYKRRPYPDKYLIQKRNYIERQARFECAAYATAYLLRHVDHTVNGAELYRDFPSKMRSGMVYPKGIRKRLADFRLQSVYCKGNMHALKHAVSQGNPPIAFIKVNPGQPMLHYVPVVGYDEAYVYLAESIDDLVNASHDHYNRKVAIKDFKKLWAIRNIRIPFYSNTYIILK